MSFDLYIQCFRNGETASFPRQWLYEAFGAYASERIELNVMVLSYPDGGGGDLYPDKGDDVHSFSINRPRGELMFDDLFALMRRAGLALYWPSLEPSLTVTDACVIAGLPKDMVELVGPATIASSGADIIAAIKA